MLNEIFTLKNYAHIGDAVWEVFVREYTIFQTQNSKQLHKITTERVNANFQKDMLEFITPLLSEQEAELVRRGRNLSIPIGRRTIQHVYRHATAFEVLVGYWHLHDKERLAQIFNEIKQTKDFN